MRATLGLSCFYHDAAAALAVDGEIVAAAQEERFSRRKHDASFPVSAISYCLEQAGVEPDDLTSIVFYDKPHKTLDRLIATYMSKAPRGLASWLTAMPAWISKKAHIEPIIASVLQYRGEILFSPHHLAHAGSAYYPSPFDEAAILTVDGVGEWATSSYGTASGTRIALLEEMRFPNSLGLFYSAFTYVCGFKVNSGEYKLMGLAPYGEPTYAELLREHVIDVQDDGTVVLNQAFFGYQSTMRMVSDRMSDLLGGPPRTPESRITKREVDLAKSVQVITEEVLLRMARHVHRQTGQRDLCLAGGVALNCVANGRLLREGPFDRIWIQPAAGDAGGALGAALLAQFNYHDVARPSSGALDRQKGSYLGPGFSEAEVAAFLHSRDIPAVQLERDDRAGTIANALADGKIVGFFSGRMEFGPRALGGRSILGDPRRVDTQRTMNLKIKYRESFRPFAPAVLAERVSEYFELDEPSPYMLLVARVNRQRCRDVQYDTRDDLIARVNRKRSDLPSITHVDYSARVQTVHAETNQLFHDVLCAFDRITGCGVVVNTSFNVRGEPIVCTPEDAYRCFMRTEIDYLYLDGYWLEKAAQTDWHEDADWRDEFTLD